MDKDTQKQLADLISTLGQQIGKVIESALDTIHNTIVPKTTQPKPELGQVWANPSGKAFVILDKKESGAFGWCFLDGHKCGIATTLDSEDILLANSISDYYSGVKPVASAPANPPQG